MKTSILTGALLLSSLAGLRADQSSTTAQKPILPAPTNYRVVDLGANHRVWQRETYEQGPGGQVMTHVHSYTELASGMNYQDTTGQWQESQELIEAYPSGAVARKGQYQVIFADNLNSAGSIDMQTPDGKRLRSNILGLMYVDTATGDAALIAQVQDASGELISSNQVLYPNAFEGVKADVQYTYKRGSFEQDVILREQPPLPDAYGMNPETTELEVLTEFIDPPAASVSDENAAEPGLEADQSINWGATRLGRGKAFNLGGQDSPARVSKRYLNLNGRHFLLEKVMLRDIAPSLSKLPEQSSNQHPLPGLAFRNPVLPKTPPVQTASRSIRMAAATPPNQGYVLDYVSLNTAYTNYTFRGDVTYYLSGTLTLSGTNTFEGGTVIKYSSYSGDFNLTQYGGALNCKTGPYRPAIFTIKDDNSVGETISGSSGNPAPMRLTDDDVYFLKIDGVSGVNLHDLRMAYGFCALALNACTNALISDVQILHAEYAVESSDSPGLIINNALIYDTFNAFALSSSQNLSCINVTFDQCYPFANGVGASVQATNCIFVNVTNASSASLDGNFNGFYNTSEFGANAITNTSNPFQKVGAGNYYLTNGCGFFNAGTTNIDATLLAGLKQRTTYPPIVYSNVTITATTLSPQAQRDTDTPDLGYHYDPLDYVVGGCDLYTNLTLTAGTAVGSFQSYGHLSLSGQPYDLSLNHGANLISTGTVTQPNWIVYADTVQEGANGAWTTKGWLGGITINGSGSGATPQMNTRFTKWSTLAAEGNLFRDNWAYGEVRATHDEFYNGGIASYWGPCYFTNCLFHYNGVAFWDQENAASLAFQNCTFYQGGLALCRYSGQSSSFWNIQNTTFDGTAFLTADNFSGNTNYTAFDYNAYNSSNTAWASYSFGTSGTPTGRLETAGVHDVIVTNFNWQSSWLGDYYLPSNSPLINHGSLTADQFGLYHFTTQTNQMPEYDSQVDIGYHYISAAPAGLLTGLMADYPFNEGTGSVASDVSGHGNDGSLVGAPVWTAGYLGAGALDFNGANYVMTSDSSSLEVGANGGDFSVTYWLYLQAGYTGSWRNLMHKGSSDSQRTFAMWMRPSDNRIHYRISTTYSWDEGGYSVSEMPLNQWTHIAYVKTGNHLQLYINGVLDSQATLVGTSISNTGPVYFGKDPWYAGTDCKLDEITVYDRALSADDITYLANTTFDPNLADIDGDGLPDSWEWNYFHSLDYSGTNLDAFGNTFLSDYQNHTDPNVIQFVFTVPSQYVSTNLVSGSISILGGVPANIAVLVDSTNFASATWTAYTSSNVTVNLGPAQGAHDVWVGLRGLPADAQPTWQETTLVLDTNTPIISITNPVNNATFNSSRVNIGGYFRSASIRQITVNDVPAFVSGTNFEALNVPLNAGTNLITALVENFAGVTNAASITIITTTNTDGSLNNPVTLSASPVTGFAPLPVTFSMHANAPGTLQRVDYDFNGDDLVDFTTNTTGSITYSYATNGEYFPLVTLQTSVGRFSSVGGWNAVALDDTNLPIRINVQSNVTMTTFASVTDPVDLKWVAPSNLYVLSRSPHTLTEFGTNGSSVRSVNNLGLNPSGFDVDASGNVYVAITGSNQVWKLNPSGDSYVKDTSFGVGGIIGNANTTTGTDPGAFNAPFDVAVSPDGGTLSVSDSGNHRIQQFAAANGAFVATFGVYGSDVGQFNTPKGLTYDSVGSLYIADSGNNRVVVAQNFGVIGVSGTNGTALGQFNGPVNISIGQRGVYVADVGNNRIQSFNLLGNGIYDFAPSDVRFAVSTNFNQPAAVAAVDGLTNEMFYVADTGNNRVILCNVPIESSDAILAIWNSMTNHIATGDISGAASYFCGDTIDNYRQSFLVIGASSLISDINQIGTLTPVFIRNDAAEYYFEKNIEGHTILFPVEFMKENGAWKIISF